MTAADIRALTDREIDRNGEDDAGGGDKGLHGDFFFYYFFCCGKFGFYGLIAG